MRLTKISSKENLSINDFQIDRTTGSIFFQYHNYADTPYCSVNKSYLIVKRLLDIGLAMLFIIIFSPVYLIAAIAVKLSTRGQIIYKQERIGLNGKPFIMYKFRSMYENSEPAGPALSSKTDCRVTPLGAFMRRYKIDEFPQFINVLKGEMSVVGPRPERNFYIKQLSEQKSGYRKILNVKPGLTSFGQIYYGYAENIEQMLERYKYDENYLHSASITTDFFIIIRTIRVIIFGVQKVRL